MLRAEGLSGRAGGVDDDGADNIDEGVVKGT